MFADKKSPTAYLQCIANIECNITINLTRDYSKCKGEMISYWNKESMLHKILTDLLTPSILLLLILLYNP